MELNEKYWGEGYQDSNNAPPYFRFASIDDNLASLYGLYNENILKKNKKIDPSAYYTWSYSSKLASYKIVTIEVTGDPDGESISYPYIKEEEQITPFANYGMARNALSISNTDMSLIKNYPRIGEGVENNIDRSYFDNAFVLTKYAPARIRWCCYVLLTPVEKITYHNHEYIYYPGPDEYMTLKNFIADTEKFNDYIDGKIHIYGLHWVPFMQESDVSIGNSQYPNIQPLINFESVSLETDDQLLADEFQGKIYYPGQIIHNNPFTQGGTWYYTAHSADPLPWQQHYRYLLTNTSDNWDIALVKNSKSTSNYTFRVTSFIKPGRLMAAFHEFAYMGMLYTNNETTARKKTHNDHDLFWGEISSITGGTSGKWHQGSDADSEEDAISKIRVTNPPAADGTDADGDPNPSYTGEDDPDNPDVDTNDYIDETPLSTPTLSTIDVFNRTYAMNLTQLRALADFLWNPDDGIFAEVIEGLKLFGENPMNVMINCRLYPFDLTPLTSSGGAIIKAGRVSTGVYGRPIGNSAKLTFYLGKCKFIRYHKNFLDFAPSTTARLFLPYCGMVSVDPAEFVGKLIEAYLIVDIMTGACCTAIFCDGVLTITANGTCGSEISMSGSDSASYANAVVNKFVGAISDIVSGVGSAAGNGAAAAMGSIATQGNAPTNVVGAGIKAGSDFFDIIQTPLQYSVRGSSTSSVENWMPQYPYFIVDIPITDIPDGYGHTVGYACCITDTLSNFSGLTVCSNVDTSGFAQATDEERSELKALLEAGVYL